MPWTTSLEGESKESLGCVNGNQGFGESRPGDSGGKSLDVITPSRRQLSEAMCNLFWAGRIQGSRISRWWPAAGRKNLSARFPLARRERRVLCNRQESWAVRPDGCQQNKSRSMLILVESCRTPPDAEVRSYL